MVSALRVSPTPTVIQARWANLLTVRTKIARANLLTSRATIAYGTFYTLSFRYMNIYSNLDGQMVYN